MAMMSGALYDALIQAGAENDTARRAAEEVADVRVEFATIKAQFDTVKWMLGVTMGLVTLFGGGTFAVLWHMAVK